MRNCLLIEPDNPYQASLMIEKLVTDKQLRIKMGEAGRKKVLATYSSEAFENKMIKVLE